MGRLLVTVSPGGFGGGGGVVHSWGAGSPCAPQRHRVARSAPSPPLHAALRTMRPVAPSPLAASLPEALPPLHASTGGPGRLRPAIAVAVLVGLLVVLAAAPPRAGASLFAPALATAAPHAVRVVPLPRGRPYGVTPPRFTQVQDDARSVGSSTRLQVVHASTQSLWGACLLLLMLSDLRMFGEELPEGIPRESRFRQPKNPATRPATSVWQGNWFSAGIGPVPKATP